MPQKYGGITLLNHNVEVVEKNSILQNQSSSGDGEIGNKQQGI